MPIPTQCPHCQRNLKVPDTAEGKSVRCSACKEVFKVETSPPELEPIPDEPSDEKLTTEPGPPKAKPRKVADDEPRRRPKRERREKPTADSAPLVIGGLLLAVMMFSCGGALIWFQFRKPAPTNQPDARLDAPQPPAPDGEKEAVVPPPMPMPGDPPKPEEKEPVRPAPVEKVEAPMPPPRGKRGVKKEPDKVTEKVTPIPKPPPPVVPELKPAELASDRVEKALPGTASAIAVGGGGRYLVLHLPDQRKLAVFDVSAAKIAHYVSTEGEDVRFAAGIDKLVVALVGKRILARYNLATGERELALPLPVDGTVKSMAMGSSSQGPLLVHWTTGTDSFSRAPFDFIDPYSLKKMDFKGSGVGYVSHRDMYQIRASADGTVFARWQLHVSPQGIGTLVVNGDKVEHHREHNTAGYLLPGPDGKYLYTGIGLYTSQAKRVGGEESRAHPLVPAVHGNLYLSVAWPDRALRPGKEGSITLHVAGDSRALVTKDFDLPKVERFGAGGWPTDQRLFFIPGAKVIVTVPASNDRLVLHRFDPETALEKSGTDYLVVFSEPVRRAASGKDYKYAMNVKSKKGDVKYKLDSGPAGMAVSAAGVVTWPVPAGFAEREVDVIVSVTDKAGQEVFHPFKITIDNP
jgi:hypothetical protein